MEPSKPGLPGSLRSGPKSRAAARSRKTYAARFSVGSNLLLVVLKVIVAAWTGSVSVLSEAIHSASDLFASGIAFFSVRASDTPPDAEHPYGHGKIESVSSVAEALLIVAAALYIIFEAMGKFRLPGSNELRADSGILVMGFSAVANFFISRFLARVATETDSQALQADAEHLRTDVITSLGVMFGLFLAKVTHLAWLDPLTALFVAVLIFRAAVRLIVDAMHPLLDARLPENEENIILQALQNDDRVLGYHKLRTRKSGSQRIADIHVQIDDDLTLVQAHDLAEELEDRIRRSLPEVTITIHIEPFRAEIRHQLEVHADEPILPVRPLSKHTDLPAQALQRAECDSLPPRAGNGEIHKDQNTL